MTKIPDWTKYYRVDTIVECYSITKETERELLRVADEVMPGGPYGGEPPGEDSWPEPDAKRDEPYKLNKIWKLLSAGVQAELEARVRKRFERDGLFIVPSEG